VPSLVGFLFRFQRYAFFFFVGSKKYKSSQYRKLKNHHTRVTVATIASKLRLCIFNRAPLMPISVTSAHRSALGARSLDAPLRCAHVLRWRQRIVSDPMSGTSSIHSPHSSSHSLLRRSFTPGLKPPFFAQILPIAAFLLFFSTDCTDSLDCLPLLLSVCVFSFPF